VENPNPVVVEGVLYSALGSGASRFASKSSCDLLNDPFLVLESLGMGVDPCELFVAEGAPAIAAAQLWMVFTATAAAKEEEEEEEDDGACVVG